MLTSRILDTIESDAPETVQTTNYEVQTVVLVELDEALADKVVKIELRVVNLIEATVIVPI